MFDGLNQRWQTLARCRGMNPAIFFPERGDNAAIAAAKQICARCPVTTQCLELARRWGSETIGIWGGTTPIQRIRLRHQERKADGYIAERIAHGTSGGYRTHRRRDEEPCDRCRSAHNTARQGQRIRIERNQLL